MLDGCGAGARAKRLEQADALGAFGGHADLDQFVRGERQLDLGQHRRTEALVADQHHRFEGVGARLERAAFGRRQRRDGSGFHVRTVSE